MLPLFCGILAMLEIIIYNEFIGDDSSSAGKERVP
jgi:hypothetical protein